MSCLGQESEDLGDISLMRLQIALEVRVEVEDN